MTPTHADAVVRAHRDLLQRNASPRAQRLTDVHGYLPGPKCTGCGAPAIARNDAHVPKCRRCGSWWPVEAIETPRRREKRMARKADHDRGLVEQSTYGTWIAHAGEDGPVLQAYLELGREKVMRLYGMSEYAVRRAVRRARQAIEARVQLAQMRGETA